MPPCYFQKYPEKQKETRKIIPGDCFSCKENPENRRCISFREFLFTQFFDVFEVELAETTSPAG